MSDARRFPVDVDRLERGSTIAPEVIEAAYQTSRDRADYSLKVLTCIAEIRRQLGPRGAGWAIRQREHGIRVLTDAEQAELMDSELTAGLRQVATSHTLQLAVDVTNLDEVQAAAHERAVMRGGSYMQAIAAARKKLRQLARQAQPAQIEGGSK